MHKIGELYNRHLGDDIYIIGTGASIRVFPKSFFDGKITIGLNLAWQLIEVNYSISMVPHLNFPEFVDGDFSTKKTIWITKRDKYKTHASLDQQKFADKNYYFFKTDGNVSITSLDQPSESGRVIDWVEHPNSEYLYLWSSISQTAVNLASNMGARNIILVGCDNCSLLNNHHAHSQHTMWKGADPNDRYMQYYEGLREVRAGLKNRDVNVLSLTPFLKLDAPELDFKFLCKDLGKPLYLENKDISEVTSLAKINKQFFLLTMMIVKRNLLFVLKKFRLR